MIDRAAGIPRLARALILSIPLLVILGFYGAGHHLYRHQFDDAYVTYRYAINLANGHGLVFNVGERTDAASSFLYALFLSTCYRLHLHDLEFVASALGLISLWLVCLFVYKVAFVISTNRPIALFVATACGLNGFLAGWAPSGMETLPFAALVIITIYLMVVNANPTLIALAITIAAFTRFEGILLLLPYVLRFLFRPRAKKPWILLLAVLFIFGCFYLGKHVYYGVWVSHAVQMKNLAIYYSPAPREMIHLWVFYASIPLLLAIPTLVRKRFLAVGIYIAASLIALTFGPRSDWGRYSLHLIPLVYAFSAPLLAKMWSGTRSPQRVAAVSLAALLMLGQSLMGERFGWINMSKLAHDQMCREKLGRYIVDHVDRNEEIATSDLGQIAYMAIDQHFVDLVALTSSDVLAHYRKGETADEVLYDKHVKFIADTYDPTVPQDRLNVLLAEFPQIHQRSEYTVDSDHPDFVCQERPDLEFIFTRITPRQAAPAVRPTSSNSCR